MLDALLGIDTRDYVRHGGRRARDRSGDFETGHSDEELGKLQRRALRALRAARRTRAARSRDAEVTLVVDHPNERARTVRASAETKASLAEDLA